MELNAFQNDKFLITLLIKMLEAGLANSTSSYLGLIIGIYVKVLVPLLSTTTVPLGNSFISDDATYGSTPSTGNPSLDLIYTDVRYQILHNGCKNYLYTFVQPANVQISPNVIAYLSSSGIRSLCNTLYVPVVIRKISARPLVEMAKLKTSIVIELNKAKITYSYLGTTFLQNLDSHINWMLMILDMVYDNPAMTISSAYSTPNWGMTGIAAANACTLAVNSIKN